MDVNNGISRGAVGTALGTGIAGLSLGVLNGIGGLGGLLGGMGGCHENMPVNRYELGQADEIAALKSQIALRDANTYNDQKLLEFYKYVDGKFGIISDKLCDQAVHNQRTEDAFVMVRQDVGAVKADLEAKIKLEAERRCCADNTIVNYVNATFYPKSVADVTGGTTTTAQTLDNPLVDCGCGC